MVYGEYRIDAETPEEAMRIAFDKDAVPELETGIEKLEILEAVPASDPMEDGEDA